MRSTAPYADFGALAIGGTNLDELGNDDIVRAISYFTKAIESNPNDARAYFSRGTARHKTSNYDSAIADLTRAVELNPCCAAAYINRGGAYYYKARYHRAITDFNKAIEIDPNSAPSYWPMKLLARNKRPSLTIERRFRLIHLCSQQKTTLSS
jgi:tetratricopeptide (TPR) repeat protein